MFCKNCGTQVEENVAFCPSCGTKLTEEAAPVVEDKPVASFQPEAVKEEKQPLPVWKKIVSMVGFGSALAVALFAFIFMFTAGIEVVSYANGKSDVAQSYDLFYYISNLEKVIENAEAVVDHYPLYPVVSIFTSLVGMFASFALIILVTVFSIITVVKGIQSLVKGEDKGAIKTAVTLFACFVCMLGLYVSPMAMLMSDGADYIIYGLNSAGTTGIVLCSIFLFLAVASQIAVNVKDYITKQGILSAIGAVVKFIAAIVLVSSFAYVVSFESDGTLVNYSAAFTAQQLSYSTRDSYIIAAAMAFITYYFTIALYILGISFLSDGIYGLVTCTKKPAGLGKAISSVVIVFIYLIFAGVACSNFSEAERSITAIPSYPILSLMFAFVYLAGSIVKMVGDKKAGLAK